MAAQGTNLQYLVDNPFGCVICGARFAKLGHAEDHSKHYRNKQVHFCPSRHCSRTISMDGNVHKHQELGSVVYKVELEDLP